MKYYKDANGEVFAYEDDGSQDDLIGDKILLREDEVATAQATAYQNRINALPYAEARRMEYPPITDYIDGVVKGDQSQINAYIQACLSVKAKYPKS